MTSTDFGRWYFSKPPHKSFFFLLQTIYLLVVLGMALLLGKHYFSWLSPAGLWWMCLSVAAPVILWIRAWQSHAKLSEISLEHRASDPNEQARLDRILTEAAYLENTGLGITLFVLMSALMAVSKILPR